MTTRSSFRNTFNMLSNSRKVFCHLLLQVLFNKRRFSVCFNVSLFSVIAFLLAKLEEMSSGQSMCEVFWDNHICCTKKPRRIGNYVSWFSQSILENQYNCPRVFEEIEKFPYRVPLRYRNGQDDMLLKYTSLGMTWT